MLLMIEIPLFLMQIGNVWPKNHIIISWELNVQWIVPLHSSDVTISLSCVLCGFAILSRTKIVLWMKYVLGVGRALAIFSLEREREQNLTHPRYVNIRGVVQHKWRMVLIRAMLPDLAFGERSTSIFHVMQNLVPLHDHPFAICIQWNPPFWLAMEQCCHWMATFAIYCNFYGIGHMSN